MLSFSSSLAFNIDKKIIAFCLELKVYVCIFYMLRISRQIALRKRRFIKERLCGAGDSYLYLKLQSVNEVCK